MVSINYCKFMIAAVTPLVGGRLGRTLPQGRVGPVGAFIMAIDERQYYLKRSVVKVQKSFLNISSQYTTQYSH